MKCEYLYLLGLYITIKVFFKHPYNPTIDYSALKMFNHHYWFDLSIQITNL